MEQITKGYKATDENMCCRGFQFELGVWYEHQGKLGLCSSGFHFCTSPSGVYSYYEAYCRVFEIEAMDVLDTVNEAGATNKKVCARIRLVREITPGGVKNTGYKNTGNMNTGNMNTGYMNSGNMNTGCKNTGNMNTGDKNTGNMNTGNMNTGNMDTGDKNTGDKNTGNKNTGDMNTGNMNTGDMNTGNMNTGDINTGDKNSGDKNTGNMNTGNMNTGNMNTGGGNATHNNTGFFCVEEPKIRSFDVETSLTREEYLNKYPEVSYLINNLLGTIEYGKVKNIPGITKKKLNKLISLHKKARQG